jgi:hypothetical protein
MAAFPDPPHHRVILLAEPDTTRMELRRFGNHVMFALMVLALGMMMWVLFIAPSSDKIYNLIVVAALITVLTAFPILTISDMVPNIPLILYDDGIVMPITWFGKYVSGKQEIIPYADIRKATFTKYIIFGKREGRITVETIFDRVYSTGDRKDFGVLEQAAEILFKKLDKKYVEVEESLVEAESPAR